MRFIREWRMWPLTIKERNNMWNYTNAHIVCAPSQLNPPTRRQLSSNNKCHCCTRRIPLRVPSNNRRGVFSWINYRQTICIPKTMGNRSWFFQGRVTARICVHSVPPSVSQSLHSSESGSLSGHNTSNAQNSRQWFATLSRHSMSSWPRHSALAVAFAQRLFKYKLDCARVQLSSHNTTK